MPECLKGKRSCQVVKQGLDTEVEHALYSQELSLPASNVGRQVVGRLRTISKPIDGRVVKYRVTSQRLSLPCRGQNFLCIDVLLTGTEQAYVLRDENPTSGWEIPSSHLQGSLW